MATFVNLTSRERKHAQLRKVRDRLRDSGRVVRQQNQELKALAARDPLTGCFNRRTLFKEIIELRRDLGNGRDYATFFGR